MSIEIFGKIPKTLKENVEWRMKMRSKAMKSDEYRQAIRRACHDSAIFFMNSQCWLFEPRPLKGCPKIIPFITWEHQDPIIQALQDNLGYRDIGVEKSRGEGASWIGVLMALRDWLFDEMSAIGLVSRTMDAADNPDDPDSLMWKLTWELTKLPTWMAGEERIHWLRNRSAHNLLNLRNGSTITAYAAVGDVASGGRKKWFLMDELSKFARGPDREAMDSTQHVTNSRLVVSTPKGAEGAYYEVMTEPNNMLKMVLSWQDNPIRRKGLYKVVKGVPIATDDSNPLHSAYDPPTAETKDMLSRLRRKGFKLEGSLRSPWYDSECDRAGATPQGIAQELDRDYGGSAYRLFGQYFMEAIEKTVAQPTFEGDLIVSKGDYRFVPEEGAPISLWCGLDAHMRPPRHAYAIGCDVSSGLGGSYTSNSVLEVIDTTTNEQVLEYVTNTTSPSAFAEKAVAIARWFYDAYLAWEHNGPGGGMTSYVIDNGYGNIYRRTQMWKRVKKRQKLVGWWTNADTKEAMFSDVNLAVMRGDLVVKSKRLSQEFSQYVRLAGKIENLTNANTSDESSRGQAHGDRVIAICVALQAAKDRPSTVVQKGEISSEAMGDEPPRWTIAHRMWELSEKQRKSARNGWDRRKGVDLCSR